MKCTFTFTGSFCEDRKQWPCGLLPRIPSSKLLSFHALQQRGFLKILLPEYVGISLGHLQTYFYYKNIDTLDFLVIHTHTLYTEKSEMCPSHLIIFLLYSVTLVNNLAKMSP